MHVQRWPQPAHRELNHKGPLRVVPNGRRHVALSKATLADKIPAEAKTTEGCSVISIYGLIYCLSSGSYSRISMAAIRYILHNRLTSKQEYIHTLVKVT